MRRLSSLILLLALSLSLTAQKSPHGESLKANCRDCHKTTGWKVDLKGISFDHQATRFPLKGQHQVVTCKACHTSLEFAKVQTECNACHTDIHQQTVGTDCARCHTSDSWVVTNIIQLHRQSRFPLIGRHMTAECKDCHTNLMPSVPSSPTASLLRFDPLGTACYDCHRNNYLATTKPNHAQNNYSTDCTVCHNINAPAWSGANTTHTFFPLVDGHGSVPCNTCHTSGNYTNISNECASCHQNKYASTSNPNHIALGIANSCKDCHSLTPGWKPAKFTIHNTYYLLQGAHTTVECNTCHNGTYPNTPTTCAGCHTSKFNLTTNPNHTVSKFPTTCETCHSQTAWTPSTFNHNTTFPLTGAHAALNCNQCHATGYPNTPKTCVECHQTKFTQTTKPNHTALGISTDCASCHTTAPGWAPATFAVHNTYYVLAGAHISRACDDCHNGNYSANSTPTTCSGCHITKYNATTNPNHAGSQFPTTCADCHTQSVWVPSTFNHTAYFPISSGRHSGFKCSECHTNASNYAVFACTTSCHPQTKMDNAHQGRSGYSYTSAACLGCHPNGSTGGK